MTVSQNRHGRAEGRRRIVLMADDWGLSEPIHHAITRAWEIGGLDATGLMMGQAQTSAAVEYARNHPGLLTGIHLFANDPDCRPLTRPGWPDFWPQKLFLHTVLPLPAVRELVLAEAEAQLAAYRATGLPLNFVNSHFHFHASPLVAGSLSQLISEFFPDFDGWMRLGTVRFFPSHPATPAIETALQPLAQLLQGGQGHWKGRRNDTLWGLDRTFAMSASEVASAAQALPSGFHEFFFHPGRHFRLDQPELGSDLAALTALATLIPPKARQG